MSTLRSTLPIPDSAEAFPLHDLEASTTAQRLAQLAGAIAEMQRPFMASSPFPSAFFEGLSRMEIMSTIARDPYEYPTIQAACRGIWRTLSLQRRQTVPMDQILLSAEREVSIRERRLPFYADLSLVQAIGISPEEYMALWEDYSTLSSQNRSIHLGAYGLARHMTDFEDSFQMALAVHALQNTKGWLVPWLYRTTATPFVEYLLIRSAQLHISGEEQDDHFAAGAARANAYAAQGI